MKEAGATVYAYDLFPEYFKAEGIACARADILSGLPVADEFADVVICQEGIEHFSDQLRALNEFNRVLKQNGSLFITTPNYSNLQARLSYFLFETEYFLKTMPANEVDSIWMTGEAGEEDIYLGHFFLLGIQRLRSLAKLAGFRIRNIIFTKASTTSLVLLPFAYPLLLLTNWWTYRNYVRRSSKIANTPREEVYRELMRLNTNLQVLVDKHLFVEFEKEADLKSVRSTLRGRHRSFDVIT